MDHVIRVLIVDDSAYVRKVLTQMLSRSPRIEVIGTAHNGREALDKSEQLRPDVITTDLMMPEMEGVAFVREQMARRPIPILIVSIASEHGQQVLAALEAGAVDVIQKPSALATDKIFEICADLITKVIAVADIPLTHHTLPAVAEGTTSVPPARSPRPHKADLIAIGISTGGPQGLKHVIPRLPADFLIPIAVVLHMPIGYTELYAQSLNSLTSLTVAEASEGVLIQPGMVLIAPAGRHLTFRRTTAGNIVTHLDTQPFDTTHRPSVDVLFQSAAEVFGPRVVGIVMTGMGKDGLQGAAWIKAHGGMIWTESAETCVVYGMPRAVAEHGLSDRSIALDQIAQALQEIG